jgi:hypothetical protein
MRVTVAQLRTVLLAQAIEQIDTDRTLVSQTEIDEATRTAVGAARQRGVPRVGAGDVVLTRAETIAQRASGRDPTVAALLQPSPRLRWLAMGLPWVALLLGLVLDRIANAHRVDLLSPPLLTVLAWNLVVYALLAWRALRRPHGRGPSAMLRTLAPWARPAHSGRGGRRGLAARIAADFHTRWLAHAAAQLQHQAARVLHLCAAAWAAGIALSLLLRGLVVRYQFGWESTFLDAGQVHAIVSALFWPLTTVFGLAPFSLQEITATQNFAGEGAAGGRWVWMYVGLLALAVVLPRLALAAWAWAREAQWARQCHIDPDAPQDAAFEALRRSLPGDLVIGLQGLEPAQAQVLHAMAAEGTPQGDRLRFADPADTAASSQPVDAVLIWSDTAPAHPLPTAWAAAPQRALRWEDCGESWVLEPALFDQLAAALPQSHHVLARLRAASEARNEQRFDASLVALAQHLRACTALGTADPVDPAADYAHHVQTLDAALRALHGNLPAHPQATTAAPNRLPALRRTDSTTLAVGTSAGAAAGAAAGAKAGALIDIGTGGLTLGAGTALGALLGGTTAWVVRAFQKKDAEQDVLRHAAEAACTRYLVIAHQARVRAQDADALAHRWHAEVTGTVAAHGAELTAALKAPQAKQTTPATQTAQVPADALLPLLRTVLRGILKRSFAPARSENMSQKSL